MNSWLTLSTAAKALDLLFISLFFSFLLFAIGTFFKWIKPTKSAFSKKDGLILEFEKDKTEPMENIDIKLNKHDQKISLFACIEDSPSFRNELTLVISKSIRFGYEIALLREVITIRNQMNSAQVKADLIKNIFVKEFSNKLMNLKKIDMTLSNFNYEIFNEFITHIIKVDILDEMKSAFKQNGLLNFSLEDYEDVYCRDRVKRILTNLRMEINTSLPDNLIPPISEVLEIMDRYETQMATYLKEAFIEARTILERHTLEEEKKKQQFDQEIMETTGVEKASRSGK